MLPAALYPDPGSNRDGLPQRCLRPSRLPIPPSGLVLTKLGKNFCLTKRQMLLISKNCEKQAENCRSGRLLTGELA